VSVSNRPRQRDVTSLSADALAAEDPTGWFERLYAANASGEATVPWDRGSAHPLLREWIAGEAAGARGDGRSAIVVGCGFGADAEALAQLGFATTGFDVSPTAIDGARSRSTHPTVEYRTADLLALPHEWHRGFDFVLESLTVQALPDPPRRDAIAAIAGLVAPGGRLLVILSARAAGAPAAAGPPWPILRSELDGFTDQTGLITERIELVTPTEPGARPRWRALFTRPAR
jgi:SAM-dependent methyltransferase